MSASVKLAGVSALALLFAGCQVTDPPARQAPSQSSGPSSWRLALFGNPQNIPAEKSDGREREYGCPAVGVLDGGAAHRVAARTGSAAGEVAHQASLLDTARECRISGTNMIIKVGVEGRMIIGAAGRAGTYTVPVRVAIKRSDAVVTSRFARVPVTIPGGETGVTFTHIEDNIVIPISALDPADEYDIFVGFDEGGGPNDPRKGRRRR